MWYPTNELYHHGVLGMHWGQRNGPPYPLSPGAHSPSEKKAGYQRSIGGGEVHTGARKKQSFAEKLGERKKAKQRMKNLKKARKVREQNKKMAAKKEEILRKGSAKDVAKIKDQLTDEDYKKVFNRLDNENKLEQRINANVKTGQERFNSIVSTIGTLKTASENAINLYNNGAKVYNTFNKSGKKLKIIGEKDTSFVDNLINKANVDKVNKNRDKLNGKELAAALSRLKTEDAFDEYYKNKRINK